MDSRSEFVMLGGYSDLVFRWPRPRPCGFPEVFSRSRRTLNAINGWTSGTVLMRVSQNLQKRLLASSCLSVRPYRTARLSLGGCSR